MATPTASTHGVDDISEHPDYIEEAKELFKKWDTNQDGTLSYDEIRASLTALHLPPTAEGIETVVHLFDKNNDGMVTEEEFLAFVMEQNQRIYKIFKDIDKNNNGSLDEDEVKTALFRLGIDYDSRVVNALFKKIDTNNNGVVEFDEFRNLLIAVPEETLEAALEYWKEAALLTISDDVAMAPITTSKAPNAALVNFAAGASSSVLSKTATAPLERLKVLFQMQTSKPPSMWTTLKSIYALDGFRGLFRGNLINLMKSSPESAVKFMVFEWAKEVLEGPDGHLSSGRNFIAGAAGGVAAHVSCFPLEVLKTQMAGSHKGEYNSIWHCIQTVYARNGVRGFYRGLGPVTVATIPQSGVSLMAYQSSKDYFASISPTGAPTTYGLMAAATISSLSGQLVSQPLHVIKTRLIMGHGNSHKKAVATEGREYGNTVLEITRNTWRYEGIHGFFRGFAPSLIKGLPSHIISYAVYEYFREVWHLEKKKKHQ